MNLLAASSSWGISILLRALLAQNLLRSAVAHTDDVQPALQLVESAPVSRVNRLDARIAFIGSRSNARNSFLCEISCFGIRHRSICLT